MAFKPYVKFNKGLRKVYQSLISTASEPLTKRKEGFNQTQRRLSLMTEAAQTVEEVRQSNKAADTVVANGRKW